MGAGHCQPPALGLRSVLSMHAGIWLPRVVIPAIIASVMTGGGGLISPPPPRRRSDSPASISRA